MKQPTYNASALLRAVHDYGFAHTARAKPDKGIGAWHPTKAHIKEYEKAILREADAVYKTGRTAGIEECRDALDSVIE